MTGADGIVKGGTEGEWVWSTRRTLYMTSESWIPRDVVVNEALLDWRCVLESYRCDLRCHCAQLQRRLHCHNIRADALVGFLS